LADYTGIVDISWQMELIVKLRQECSIEYSGGSIGDARMNYPIDDSYIAGLVCIAPLAYFVIVMGVIWVMSLWSED
jgi:hypothetical protein